MIVLCRRSYRELRSRWLDDPEVKESAKFQDQKHRIGMHEMTYVFGLLRINVWF